eukprot:Awhi_evm1s11205
MKVLFSINLAILTVSGASLGDSALSKFSSVYDEPLGVSPDPTPIELPNSGSLSTKEDFLEACAKACLSEESCGSFSLRDIGNKKFACSTHSIKDEKYGAWVDSENPKDVVYTRNGYTGCGEGKYFGYYGSDEGLFGAVSIGCHEVSENCSDGDTDVTNNEGGCPVGKKCRWARLQGSDSFKCYSPEEAAKIDAEEKENITNEKARQDALASPDMKKVINVSGYESLFDQVLSTEDEKLVSVESLAGEKGLSMALEEFVQQCADACNNEDKCLLFGYAYTPDLPKVTDCRLMTKTDFQSYFSNVDAVLNTEDYTWNKFMQKKSFKCESDGNFNGNQPLQASVSNVGCQEYRKERYNCGEEGIIMKDFTTNNNGCTSELNCLLDRNDERYYICRPKDYDPDQDVYDVHSVDIGDNTFYVSHVAQVVSGHNEKAIKLSDSNKILQEDFDECAKACGKDKECNSFEVVFDKGDCHLMSFENIDSALLKDDLDAVIGKKSSS